MNGLQKLHDNFKTKEILEKDIKKLKWQRNTTLFLFVILLLMFIGNLYQIYDRENSVYNYIDLNTYKESMKLNICKINNIETGNKISIWCDNISEYFGKPLSG